MNNYTRVEQLLSNYKMLEISIKNMKQEIDYLEKEDGMSGISYDGISTSKTNECKSSTESTVLSNMEKIHYLEHSILRATRQIESVDRVMDGLNDVERIVIEQRYIDGKQWWQVAYKANYGERHCKRLRSEAIEKMVIGIFGVE